MKMKMFIIGSMFGIICFTCGFVFCNKILKSKYDYMLEAEIEAAVSDKERECAEKYSLETIKEKTKNRVETIHQTNDPEDIKEESEMWADGHLQDDYCLDGYEEDDHCQNVYDTEGE